MLIRAVLASLVAVLGWNIPVERMRSVESVDTTGGVTGGIAGLEGVALGLVRSAELPAAEGPARAPLEEGVRDAVLVSVGATPIVASRLSAAGTTTWTEPQQEVVVIETIVIQEPVTVIEPAAPVVAPVSSIEVVEESEAGFEAVVDAMVEQFAVASEPEPVVAIAPPAPLDPVVAPESPETQVAEAPAAEVDSFVPYPGLAYELNFANDGIEDAGAGLAEAEVAATEELAPVDRLGSAVRLTGDALRAWADVLLPTRATVVAGKDRLAR